MKSLNLQLERDGHSCLSGAATASSSTPLKRVCKSQSWRERKVIYVCVLGSGLQNKVEMLSVVGEGVSGG